MQQIDVEQRRARLARRHRLVDRGDDVAEITDAMVALHATDPATVYLSAIARLAEPSLDAVATALYDDRSVVRILAMRRTLFVVTRGALAAIERSSTTGVGRKERARLETFLADGGLADPARFLADVAPEVLAALGDEGATARELTKRVPALATKIVMGAGTRNEATVGATSRVLGVLANEGVVVRGRPTGSWTGRQYRWHGRRRWLGAAEGGVSALAEAEIGAEVDAAAVVVAERWLRTFGPAPLSDLAWWTKWGMTRTRRAVAALDVVEVDLDGEVGLVMADDVDPVEGPAPWASLLPALDPTPMGWKTRDWFLGDHQGALFDRNGNIGPTVWVDGRIVGGWGQHRDGTIVVDYLESVPAARRRLVDTEVERLAAAIGQTVIKPSFPTPLQRSIAAG